MARRLKIAATSCSIHRWTGRLLFLCLGFLVSGSVRADSTAEPPKSVTIHGHTRTHTSYIEKLVRDCLDGAAYPQQPGYLDSYLTQCMINTKLFEKIKINFTSNTIEVEVQERWTLIPIPYLQVNTGNSRQVGLIVLESNFGGEGKMLAGGAALSNVGASFFGYYQDPAIFFSNWRGDILADHVNQQLRLYKGRKIVDSFIESTNGVLGGFGYRWSNLVTNAHLGARQRAFVQDGQFTPPTNQTFTYLNALAEYSNKDFHFYGNHGISFKVNATRQLTRSDDVERAANADYLFSFERIVIKHALQVQLAGGTLVGGAKEDAYRLGGNKGFRGVERYGVWADHYQVVAMDYQVPVESFDDGTVTIGLFNDFGVLHQAGANGYATNFDSFGIATYFYLTAIALPGIGIEFGLNKQFQGPFANLTIGLSI